MLIKFWNEKVGKGQLRHELETRGAAAGMLKWHRPRLYSRPCWRANNTKLLEYGKQNPHSLQFGIWYLEFGIFLLFSLLSLCPKWIISVFGSHLHLHFALISPFYKPLSATHFPFPISTKPLSLSVSSLIFALFLNLQSRYVSLVGVLQFFHLGFCFFSFSFLGFDRLVLFDRSFYFSMMEFNFSFICFC